MTTHIKIIRKALEDSAAEPRWIRNIRTVGYQFIGEVRVSETTRELSFRRDPKPLTPAEAKAMICDKGFYRSSWNETAHGVAHEYKLQVIGNDVVVVEAVSGLMWQKDNLSADYEKAHELVGDRNARRVGGFDDWRLPTLEEAMSLMTTPQAGFNVELVTPGDYVGGTWLPDETSKAHCPHRPHF